MNFVNTIIVDGKAYTVQDPNGVPRADFDSVMGDVAAALETLHSYAQGLGGGSL